MIFSLLMNVPAAFLGFSLEGILVTVAMSVGIFLISSISAVWYLRKVNIIELLRSDKKEKKIKHLWLHIILTVVFGLGAGYAVYAEYKGLMTAFNGEPTAGGVVAAWLYGTILFVMLFHIEFAKSITGILLKCKRLASKYTNTVILRNVSGVMSVNALMIGVLATIMVAAVSISAISFVEKELTNEYISIEAPFDIVGEVPIELGENIPIEEAERIIEEYADIVEKYQLPIYADGKAQVLNAALGEHDMGWTDKYVSLSDMNVYLKAIGREPLSLEGNQYIVCGVAGLNGEMFQNIHPVFHTETYSFAYLTQNFPLCIREFIYMIVPDKAVEGMNISSMGYAFTLKDNDYDLQALSYALSYEEKMDGMEPLEDIDDEEFDEVTEYGTDFRLRALIENYYMEQTGILVIGMGYIATVFIFMALAILALKVLSGMDEDRMRYEILNHLGVDREKRKKTLYKQIGLFFFMPLTGPVLMIAPLSFIFGRLLEQWNMPFLTGAGICIINAICIFTIYIIYYLITCEVAKREILR